MTANSAQTLANALQLHKTGQVRAAEQLYRQILTTDPRHVDALNLLGAACLHLGQGDEAIQHLQQAVAIAPGHASAHDNLGVALAQAGRLHEASGAFSKALELNPHSAPTLINLGSAFSKLGRTAEAANAYSHAVRLQPASAPAHYELGNTLAKLGRMDEGISHLREAVRLKPTYPEAWNNLGNLLIKQNQFDAAADSFRQALAIKPGYARAMSNLGVVLTEQGNLDKAVATLEQLVQLDPTFAEGYNNLGVARMKQGRLPEALADIEAAIRINPEYAEPYKNRAIVWLFQGDYARGWPAFETRWKSKDYPKYLFDAPRWDGSPLDGRTILLHAEQGLGDAIQFVRYAPLVKGQGGRVILQTPKPLVPLLARSAGIDQLVALGDELPKFECYASPMSLPALLGTTIDTVPKDVPYLQVDQELVDRWRSELARLEGFRIGIAWQGNREFRGDHLRSFPLRHIAAIAAVPSVRLLSLQRGPGAEQADDPTLEFSVHRFGPDFDRAAPFLDTAAVMQNVDLVITSDTAVAHLAGALGVPTWVALGFSPDWRWMLSRSDTPWYPTMKLFRQPAVGRWDQVFMAMAAELRAMIDSRKVAGGQQSASTGGAP